MFLLELRARRFILRILALHSESARFSRKLPFAANSGFRLLRTSPHRNHFPSRASWIFFLLFVVVSWHTSRMNKVPISLCVVFNYLCYIVGVFLIWKRHNSVFFDCWTDWYRRDKRWRVSSLICSFRSYSIISPQFYFSLWYLETHRILLASPIPLLPHVLLSCQTPPMYLLVSIHW